ncbi:hypothetical protein [Nonomuraea turcica]|uniref:hypothetical protein n=1 Tax=Nonomuraea sp. G32 TaxID=3067274 RepID=UPI00273BB859|nr:hypothetical protein [Nonomuraea sp. G32]MDP4511012.1 hypothetical protein [Nonomuraea sp. G32]
MATYREVFAVREFRAPFAAQLLPLVGLTSKVAVSLIIPADRDVDLLRQQRCAGLVADYLHKSAVPSSFQRQLCAVRRQFFRAVTSAKDSNSP